MTRDSELVTGDRSWLGRRAAPTPDAAGAGVLRVARSIALPLALAVVTFVAFLPVLWNGFVAWDDDKILTENLDYRGLGWTQLSWMFTTVRLGHYIPLTWLTFGLDYVLWGMDPVGYHLTNLLLHVATVLLFYVVARDLLARATSFSNPSLTMGAAAAALFFGLHPLRVESVAWATERRDVLSGALFLATVLLYLRASQAEGARRRRLLGLSVVAYLLALAAKSIVMTLPVVLVLLDVYPLGRLPANPRAWLGRGRAVLWEKLPYVMLATAGAITSYVAQRVVEGPTPYGHAGYLWRAANVGYSLWFYVFKTAVPAGLSPLYEIPPQLDPFEPRFLANWAGVLGITLLVVLLRHQWPAGLAVWSYYAMVLAPVSGVFPMGVELVADRYSYLPGLGLALLVGGAAGAAREAAAGGALRPRFRQVAIGVGMVALVGMSALTWRQTGIWRDTDSLFGSALAVAPDCGYCHAFLGQNLLSRQELVPALEHLRLAVALRTDRPDLHAAVGQVYARLGRWPDAAEEYRVVVGLYPGQVSYRNGLAMALHGMGKPAEAVAELREALRLEPASLVVRLGLGFALNDLGEFPEATEHFRRAIELKPDSAMARLGLVRAYAGLGRKDLARQQYETLRSLNPELAASIDRRWVATD